MKKRKVERVQVCPFNKMTNFFSNIIIALLAISCTSPFIFVATTSVTNESALSMYGYSFWLEKFSLPGYMYLLDQMQSKIFRALYVIVLVTILDTPINSMATSLYVYVISRSNFPLRRFLTVFCLIAVLFLPGVIANYLVMTNPLQLKDTIWVLVLPMAVNPLNIIVMHTFSKRSISDSIAESARIDGASGLRTFTQTVLSLAIPGIVTVSLSAALGYWDDWFNALLYIRNGKLVPLQHLLMKIQSNIQRLIQGPGIESQLVGGLVSVPGESAKMAIVVISTLSIAISYPFFQKHFVKGSTVGGVKG